MSEQKTFQTIDILAVYTSRATGGEFQDMHELIEWIHGQPVWTHQLAKRKPWATASERLAAQVSDLGALSEPPAENEKFIEWTHAAMASLAPSYVVERGSGKSEAEAQEGAIASLLEMAGDRDKSVIVVSVDS